MRRVELLVLVLVIVVALIGVAAGSLGSSRAASPAVTVELASDVLRPGGGFNGDVRVWVKNVPNPDGLGAYDLRINFDPTKIRINTVSGGVPPFGSTPINNAPSLANSTGELRLNFFQASMPGPTGNVHIATVNISALSAGQHQLTPVVVAVTLADASGSNISNFDPIATFVQAYDPPVANFSGSTTSGRVPLAVNFTDSSTGPATSWSWDLDGNGTADRSTKNPSFTYTQPGNYDVSLTAQNPQGTNTKTVSNYIRAYDDPRADFAADKVRGRAPLVVQFMDQSTGNISAWEWDLTGDGNADSSSRNPTYRYTRAGKYAVTLKATNPLGNDTKTRANYIQVQKLRVKKSFRIERDDDGVIVLPIDIGDISDPDTGEKIKPNKGIKEFSGEVNFGSGLSMLGGRKGGQNFNDPAMTHLPGKSTFSGSSKTPGKHDTETRIAKLVPRLTGAKDAMIDITLTLQSITEGDEDSEMEEEGPSTLSFRRGAARGGTTSNITDALFVAQYLAGVRDGSQLNLLNAASILHDGASGDKISVADAMALAQQLAGLRDNSFSLLN